jgi:LytS/YehU family sensor histidine kinase
LVQPFIENSIWHGLLPKKEAGKVTVSFKNTENSLQCIVEDNGIGREKSAVSKKDKDKNRISYGMILIEDRLRLLNEMSNHTTNGFQIIDLKNEQGEALGTKVIMNIPRKKM